MVTPKNVMAGLLKAGNARVEGRVFDASNNKTYWALTDTLHARTSHVFYGWGDLRNHPETAEEFFNLHS